MGICKKCHEHHEMGIGNRETGEFEPIDVCYDCLFIGTYQPVTVPIVLEEWGGTLHANIEGRVQNLATYLNKQQAKLINEMEKNSGL